MPIAEHMFYIARHLHLSRQRSFENHAPWGAGSAVIGGAAHLNRPGGDEVMEKAQKLTMASNCLGDPQYGGAAGCRSSS